MLKSVHFEHCVAEHELNPVPGGRGCQSVDVGGGEGDNQGRY